MLFFFSIPPPAMLFGKGGPEDGGICGEVEFIAFEAIWPDAGGGGGDDEFAVAEDGRP